MEVFNLFGDDWDSESGPEGYHRRMTRVGARIGAALLGATLYELETGERTWPYHYEWGGEEWLLVVAGRPVLRSPDGERELRAGDVACFPEGPAGAHQVRNDAAEPARVLIFSTKGLPGVVVYPDSEKVGVFTGTDDTVMFQRSANVDYWEGE